MFTVVTFKPATPFEPTVVASFEEAKAEAMKVLKHYDASQGAFTALGDLEERDVRPLGQDEASFPLDDSWEYTVAILPGDHSDIRDWD